MKARVKDIADGTFVNDGGHQDDFVMVEMVGKTIDVIPARDLYSGDRWENWFQDKKRDREYYYHRSWLTFPKKRRASKGEER